MVIATRAPARAPSVGWQESAACKTAEPELFFPISATGRSRADTARARAICHDCPVRQACLDYAMATSQQHGIWGGFTEEERHRRRRAQARQRLGPLPR
jgi:WhiB family transcriptional regulator, redox-sensing transcriptional regulator